MAVSVPSGPVAQVMCAQVVGLPEPKRNLLPGRRNGHLSGYGEECDDGNRRVSATAAPTARLRRSVIM